jgi:hypothetical protein
LTGGCGDRLGCHGETRDKDTGKDRQHRWGDAHGGSFLAKRRILRQKAPNTATTP